MLYRLRQVDVKAEHFERHVQRLEQERDAWEKKYEVGANAFDLAISVDCSPSITYRTPKRSTGHRRQSWTTSLPTWKASKLPQLSLYPFPSPYNHRHSSDAASFTIRPYSFPSFPAWVLISKSKSRAYCTVYSSKNECNTDPNSLTCFSTSRLFIGAI